MANKIPVYVFTGFLEGGKTHIIQESMEDQRFNSGEKTLLIMCEEGIEELDLDRFWGKNVYLELIEDPADLNRDYLTLLYKKHKIDRVIIEYNGMWLLSQLYAALPADWFIFQNMMFADAKTFLTYNANMRQLMVDKLQDCEMIVLNRTPEVIDKEEIHRVVRSVSTRASITYDYPDGHVEYDEIEDPLPYDMDAPIIDIKDEDYAIFYRDLAEDTDKYDGKTVRFKGIVARDRALGKNGLIIGRHVMTCCADDIAYNAVVCYFQTSVNLKTRDWTIVTAKIKIEKHKLYGRPGPVLYAEKTEFATKPTQEVATFY